MNSYHNSTTKLYLKNLANLNPRMIFYTQKHILRLEIYQGNRYTGNRQTDRQTERHTTRLPYALVAHAHRGIKIQPKVWPLWRCCGEQILTDHDKCKHKHGCSFTDECEKNSSCKGPWVAHLTVHQRGGSWSYLFLDKDMHMYRSRMLNCFMLQYRHSLYGYILPSLHPFIFITSGNCTHGKVATKLSLFMQCFSSLALLA